MTESERPQIQTAKEIHLTSKDFELLRGVYSRDKLVVVASAVKVLASPWRWFRLLEADARGAHRWKTEIEACIHHLREQGMPFTVKSGRTSPASWIRSRSGELSTNADFTHTLLKLFAVGALTDDHFSALHIEKPTLLSTQLSILADLLIPQVHFQITASLKNFIEKSASKVRWQKRLVIGLYAVSTVVTPILFGSVAGIPITFIEGVGSFIGGDIVGMSFIKLMTGTLNRIIPRKSQAGGQRREADQMSAEKQELLNFLVENRPTDDYTNETIDDLAGLLERFRAAEADSDQTAHELFEQLQPRLCTLITQLIMHASPLRLSRQFEQILQQVSPNSSKILDAAQTVQAAQALLKTYLGDDLYNQFFTAPHQQSPSFTQASSATYKIHLPWLYQFTHETTEDQGNIPSLHEGIAYDVAAARADSSEVQEVEADALERICQAMSLSIPKEDLLELAALTLQLKKLIYTGLHPGQSQSEFDKSFHQLTDQLYRIHNLEVDEIDTFLKRVLGVPIVTT